MNEEDLRRLELPVENVKKMSVETFDKHSYSCSYRLKYHERDDVVDRIGRFVALSPLESDQNEQFHVQKEQKYKASS